MKSMSKIDIDKFVCSLLEYFNDNGEWMMIDYFCSSLNDQGLEYKGGEIVNMDSPSQVGFEELGKVWKDKINPSEFDKRLNALLKKFESLPKEELVDSLEFYLKVVRKETPFDLMRLKEVAKSESDQELTEFEKQFEAYMYHPNTDIDVIKACSKKLFTIAKKQFINREMAIDEKIRKGLIKGLSAMRDIHKHQTFSDEAININDAIAWLESLI